MALPDYVVQGVMITGGRVIYAAVIRSSYVRV